MGNQYVTNKILPTVCVSCKVYLVIYIKEHFPCMKSVVMDAVTVIRHELKGQIFRLYFEVFCGYLPIQVGTTFHQWWCYQRELNIVDYFGS